MNLNFGEFAVNIGTNIDIRFLYDPWTAGGQDIIDSSPH